MLRTEAAQSAFSFIHIRAPIIISKKKKNQELVIWTNESEDARRYLLHQEARNRDQAGLGVSVLSFGYYHHELIVDFPLMDVERICFYAGWTFFFDTCVPLIDDCCQANDPNSSLSDSSHLTDPMASDHGSPPGGSPPRSVLPRGVLVLLSTERDSLYVLRSH
jgi:hypothetical protein